MKRNAPDYSGPPNKASRPDGGIVLRLLIPSRAAGIIIGKKGETIKKIRQDHNARMNIPDAHGPERVFIIEADMQTCVNVVGDLIPKLKDIIDGRLSDPKVIMGKRPQAKRDEKDTEDIVDIRILVHQSQAGCVIGRGGERIRELRQNHSMKVIKVYQIPAPESTDRVVQMVASPDNVLQCMQVVLDSLENAPPRGPRHDYQADYCNEHMALDYGGWISPGGPRGPPGPPAGGPPMMGGYDGGYGAYPPAPQGMYGSYPPMGAGPPGGGYPPKGGAPPPRGPPRGGADRPPRGPPRGGPPPQDKGYDYYPPPQAGPGWEEPSVDAWM